MFLRVKHALKIVMFATSRWLPSHRSKIKDTRIVSGFADHNTFCPREKWHAPLSVIRPHSDAVRRLPLELETPDADRLWQGTVVTDLLTRERDRLPAFIPHGEITHDKRRPLAHLQHVIIRE